MSCLLSQKIVEGTDRLPLPFQSVVNSAGELAGEGVARATTCWIAVPAGSYGSRPVSSSHVITPRLNTSARASSHVARGRGATRRGATPEGGDLGEGLAHCVRRGFGSLAFIPGNKDPGAVYSDRDRLRP